MKTWRFKTQKEEKNTGGFGEGTPASLAVDADVVDEALVFLFGPSAFIGVGFLTARRPSHNSFFFFFWYGW